MKNVPILYQWHFDLLTILFTFAIIYLYYSMSGFRPKKNAFCFWLSIGIFLIAECSPLHFLGMNYYFSAHMIVHVVLLLICGPLLVMSIPPDLTLSMSKHIQSLSSFLSHRNWLAWFAGVGIMWLWHIPAIFDASMAHMQGAFNLFPLLHAASMLIAGMLFSWPLFCPLENYRIHPLSGVLYLFTACISCSLLGLLITFAPIDTYHHYLNLNSAMGMPGINPMGISREEDQQAAGLIMWVPCCFVYLGGCIFLLYRWFSESNSKQNKEWTRLNPLINHHHD